jgi:predicted DNA-binding protein (MmcQ/YjbR family)
MTKRKITHDAAEAALRAQGLGYPEATEDFPWGHRALKVRGKAFCFLSREDGALSVTTKLPSSGLAALDLPFTEPTGYGLGRSGWVTARFAPDAQPPLDILALWLEESYRAVAPKRLGKLLDERAAQG